jgi:hypothetical protein
MAMTDPHASELVDAVEALVAALRERAKRDRRLAGDAELCELAVVALHRAKLLSAREASIDRILIDLDELEVAMRRLDSSVGCATGRASDRSPSG